MCEVIVEQVEKAVVQYSEQCGDDGVPFELVANRSVALIARSKLDEVRRYCY